MPRVMPRHRDEHPTVREYRQLALAILAQAAADARELVHIPDDEPDKEWLVLDLLAFADSPWCHTLCDGLDLAQSRYAEKLAATLSGKRSA